MITPPAKRIWLFPAPDGTLEVILLGSMGEICWEFAIILKTAERWPGFQSVDPIMLGHMVLGLRCSLGPLATHNSPVDEALAWLAADDQFIRRVEWSDASRVGKIGTW